MRSVLLGLGCVMFIAAFAPYNDFALNNTFFIGNHFPVGVTLLMCLLVLAMNPLLGCVNRNAPLHSGELITVWSMCLVGAAFPTSGLLRPLIPLLAAPIYMLPQQPHWEPVLDFLPQWMFPTTNPDNDRIVTQFFLGSEPDQPAAVPWGPWVKALSLWALYFVPFYAGVLLLSILFSRQWIENEKLQYPIASVMLEMVRDAPPGRRLNALFSDRGMWTAAVVVMAIHLINGLHTYFPKVPPIPLHYDLGAFTTEGMWDHLMTDLKINGVYFSMVGIAFLMAAEVALSLWLMVVIYGVAMGAFLYHGINPWEAMRSQSYGAMLAMGAFLLYLARAHLWRTFRIAFGPARDEEDRRVLPYRWVVRGLIGCVVCCVAWLCAAGMSLPVAVAQIVLVYLMYLVMSRLVAETGLFFVQPRMWTEHLFPLIAPRALSPKNYALVVKTVYATFHPRETLMPFAFNALRMSYETQRGQGESTDVAAPVRRSFLG
ncbi:MAG: hypothetical protein QGH33_15685, partial [Pirellulaceae bacterium]|nr:hypothetical protein [Pirellulaceae bacterium]